MLLLLHGPAISASRAKLLKLRQKFDPASIVVFEKGSDPQDVMAAIMTPSLLDGEQLIILENPPEDLQLPSILDTNPLSLILWFDHEVAEKKPVMSWARKEQILYFPPEKEQNIFPFLDLLAQKNPQAFAKLSELQKTHEKFSDNQYLITMILYLLRTLLVIPKNAAPFLKQKLLKQRRNFTEQKLQDLYRFVLETDFKIKNGLMDEAQAQFMLVNKFLC